jgi:8-oxo-dGTP diphosphatase
MKSTDIHFCPRCGSPIKLEFVFHRERPVCTSCHWMYFADPKVAAGILIENDGKVLLVRRVNDPFKGFWTLPAGFVDADEDPARAAERECLEETGLTVQATAILDIRWGREHPRGADFIIFYRGQVTGGQLLAGDDADEVDWFDRAHLPPLAFKSTTEILKFD